MAKQRRARSRPVRSKPVASPPTTAVRPAIVAARISTDSRTTTDRPADKAPRPGYLEAVALYEQGVAAIQAHDYSRGSSVLRSVLSRYPQEKELHERVRLYLNVCERHMTPRAVSPSTPEERVFAATLAVNAGNYDEALEHLRRASSEAPDYDHALYMLASVLALRDEIDEAVPVLLRAIELNPENRAMARHDPDLERLRQYDNVRAALEASNPAKIERRKAPRRR
jgi:tetratricopeptide (TPR) repeat protein